MERLSRPRSSAATPMPQDRPEPRRETQPRDPAEQPNPGDPGPPILEPRMPVDPSEDPRMPAVTPPRRGEP